MNKVIIKSKDNGIIENKQHETIANKSCYTTSYYKINKTINTKRM